jgi:hypothetical protein
VSTKAIAPRLHGADKKIGQHPGPATTVAAITLKQLAGEKQRGAGNLYELKAGAVKHTINVLDTRIADRKLRIHDGVITTGPRIAAASSLRKDQRAHLGSFVAMSRSTFVSFVLS